MSDNLILWACVIWLPIMMYILLKNETKFKKNIALGITLPQEARSDEAVLAILSSFKKWLLLACAGLLLLAVPCALIPGIGKAMTVWLIWVDVSIVLPYVPYVYYHKKLKLLKEDRGWRQNGNAVSIAVLPSADQTARWLSPWLFLLPLLLSLLPMTFDREYWYLYLIDALTVLFCWFGYRYLYRNKSEAVDDNMALTEALTRIRRYNWGKCWLVCAWFLAILNIAIWLTQHNYLLSLMGILLLSAILVITVIRIELKTRQLQETMTAQSGTDFFIDEDDKWIWGMFYYNPNDSRLIINNRVGMNSTVNLAKRSGQVLMAATALLLLAMPLLGVWMDHLESTPVALELQETTVVALHTGVEYEIPLDTITHLEYVAQLPEIGRVAGTGMDTVQKGRYKTPWGSASVCLDPRTGPYLYLETDNGKRYLFGSSTSAQTEEVYRQLEEQLN